MEWVSMKRRDFLKLTGVGMLSAMAVNYGIVQAKDRGKEGQERKLLMELPKVRKVDGMQCGGYVRNRQL